MKIPMAARRLNSTIKFLILTPLPHPMHGCVPEPGEVDLAMISQTALATKLRRADNQPLACVLTLHNT